MSNKRHSQNDALTLLSETKCSELGNFRIVAADMVRTRSRNRLVTRGRKCLLGTDTRVVSKRGDEKTTEGMACRVGKSKPCCCTLEHLSDRIHTKWLVWREESLLVTNCSEVPALGRRSNFAVKTHLARPQRVKIELYSPALLRIAWDTHGQLGFLQRGIVKRELLRLVVEPLKREKLLASQLVPWKNTS